MATFTINCMQCNEVLLVLNMLDTISDINSWIRPHICPYPDTETLEGIKKRPLSDDDQWSLGWNAAIERVANGK